jgi:hypothetical protein
MANPEDNSRKDTRGLPEGYDPRKFYEYRTSQLIAAASGVELFVYRLMPFNVIKSVVFAIDPFSQFRTSAGIVTPANRKRIRATDNVLLVRPVRRIIHNTSYSSISNWRNIPGNVGPVADNPPFHNESVFEQPRQEVLPDYTLDTTKRTRLINSDIGTLELFKSSINSPGRTVRSSSTSRSTFTLNSPPNDFQTITGGTDSTSYTYEGNAGRLALNVFNNFVTSEKNYLAQLMSSNILKMITGTLPEHRDYTLFRNAVELRDFRRSILQLQETMRNLSALEKALKIPSHKLNRVRRLKTSLKDIPKEYVGYHFGWAQTYRDVFGLLSTPDKIAKKINFLLSRNGKDTTYRTKRNFPSSVTGVSGFDYDGLSGEYELAINSHIDRETELRLVINANYRFPDVDLPSFLSHLFKEKLGLYPSVTDMYNLVPWTWLLDWFTGVGNYIEVIDNINHDRTLINWGMLTGVTKGKLVTEFSSKSDNWSRVYVNNVQVSEDRNVFRNAHTSTLEYTLQLRNDVANLPNVHKTSDISSLTDYQKSILAGIISQSGKKKLHI